MSTDPAILTANGPVLSTMEEDGSRRWLYPKLARGRFWSRRRAVAYLLIAVYAALPFLTVHGKPAILLDVMHRRFTLLGFTFLPTDTILLALFLVSVILAIFLMTALAGRVWCGWACPQTVYMEFLFRPIERLFTGRRGAGGKPRPGVAGWRYPAMYAAFFAVSLHLANTFLAYFVGAAQLHQWITLSSPLEHPAGFCIVAAVTGAMLFNFAWFREQTCLIACPYGRLQSVLLDRSSLIVSYDKRRGEPRGKLRRAVSGQLPVVSGQSAVADAKTSLPLPLLATGNSPLATTSGDCVDCGNCVTVCPTGIDIRNGLQFECVHCAQCIDACDAVMDKIGRPRGLIRYGSQAGMAGEKARLLRPRVIVYPALLIAVVSLLAFLLVTKAPADVSLLRAPGQPFLLTPSGEVENVMRVKLTNRTDRAQRFRVTVPDKPGVRAAASQETIEVPAGASREESVQVLAAADSFRLGTLDVTLRVSGVGPDAGLTIDRPCRLLGPANLHTNPWTQEGADHEGH